MAKSISKKDAPKKAGGKKQKDIEDDFNEPVFIEPKKQDQEPGAESYEKDAEQNLTKAEKELNVEVTKGKISNDIFLSASWKNLSKEDRGSYEKEGENPIHDDLKTAFAGLNYHLALMSQQYDEDGELDVSRIVCRGFSIGSNGEGVTLHGSRHLSNGKAFNFNSPFYKWDNDPSASLFDEEHDSLKSALNIVRAEIIQYLFKHKYQPEIVPEESNAE